MAVEFTAKRSRLKMVSRHGLPEDSSNLSDPSVIAAEIVDDLHATLEQFAQISADSWASCCLSEDSGEGER